MRIIAGTCKGRRLASPTWPGVRPTSDRLRETLFNILAPRIEGTRVADGYAGTGAIGLEALSRGAAQVVFIEQDRRAVALIERNSAACGMQGRYTIECGDVAAVLRRRATPFDLILLDPPYDESDVPGVLMAAAGCVTAGGLVVLEHATRRRVDGPARLRLLRVVRSGDSSLTFFVPHAGADDLPEPQ